MSYSFFKIKFILLSGLMIAGIFFIPGLKALATDQLSIININIETDTNSATISWTTNLPSKARLAFGSTENLGSWIQDNNLNTNHQSTIGGFEVDHKYYVQILADDGQGGYATSSIVDFTTVNKHPPTLSNIQTTFVGGQNITFVFNTDKLATGCIYYGVTQNLLDKQTCDGGSTMIHEIPVSGLASSTYYIYRAYAKDSDNKETYSVFYNIHTTNTADNSLPDLSVHLSNSQAANPNTTSTNMILSFLANRPIIGTLSWGVQSKTYTQSLQISVPHVNTLNLTLLNLDFNQKYYYILTATDIFNNQVTTIEQSFLTPDSQAINNDNVYNPTNPDQDFDHDGLTNAQEQLYGTDPQNPDSDNDGYLDGEEVANGYNPLGPGRMNQALPAGDYAYGKARLGIAPEKALAISLKTELVKKFKHDFRLTNRTWTTYVNAYVYGGYPVIAIYQAIIHGGKTVHATIPWEVWKDSQDYQDNINN